MTAGTTIETALQAVFGLCVPAVSGGRLEQTVPPEAVVFLTAEERGEFFAAIEQGADAWRVVSEDGMILLQVLNGTCSIATADGDPIEIERRFFELLGEHDGRRWPDLPHGDPGRLDCQINLAPGEGVYVMLSIDRENGEGFYASATRFTQEH